MTEREVEEELQCVVDVTIVPALQCAVGVVNRELIALVPARRPSQRISRMLIEQPEQPLGTRSHPMDADRDEQSDALVDCEGLGRCRVDFTVKMIGGK